MKFDIPEDSNPIIKVIGVVGGGSNAVNYMYEKKIVGVDFAICNTDNQAMNLSAVGHKIQLGPTLTEGRGAGSKPGIGTESCIESLEEVKEYFNDGTKMLFVTAGMGGGTGTGAAPVIAKAAQELDILTVGIVTVPFTFEGRRRMKQAMEGLAELKKNVDTLIVISNDKLRKIYGNLNLSEAFSKADDILMTAAKGIGGGFPLGACLATEEAALGMVVGTHGTTYGGNPLAMAVGNAVLDEMLKPEFFEHVIKMGEMLFARLQGLQQRHSNMISEVRGSGLMAGIRLPDVPTRPAVTDLISRGFCPAPAGDNVIRMLPPLILNEDHIDEAVTVVEEAMTDWAKDGVPGA